MQAQNGIWERDWCEGHQTLQSVRIKRQKVRGRGRKKEREKERDHWESGERGHIMLQMVSDSWSQVSVSDSCIVLLFFLVVLWSTTAEARKWRLANCPFDCFISRLAEILRNGKTQKVSAREVTDVGGANRSGLSQQPLFGSQMGNVYSAGAKQLWTSAAGMIWRLNKGWTSEGRNCSMCHGALLAGFATNVECQQPKWIALEPL